MSAYDFNKIDDKEWFCYTCINKDTSASVFDLSSSSSSEDGEGLLRKRKPPPNKLRAMVINFDSIFVDIQREEVSPPQR